MPEIRSIKEIALTVVITTAMLLILCVGMFLWGMESKHIVITCTVSNESALEAAWVDGYRTGISRARVGNDTGWSWNYSVPECVP